MSRRQALANVDLRQASNPGLVLDRYAVLRGDDPQGRTGSMRTAIDTSRNLIGLYRKAFNRWTHSLQGAATAVVDTGSGRVLIGSGDTVYESSIRLHGTYGVPVIPGSSLKGLAAAYAASVWGCEEVGGDREFSVEGSAYQCMFGTQDGQGLIVFHDAWLEPASLAEAMQMDVLTVHYPYYYRGQAAGLYDIEIMDPRPIPFISVKGRFLVAVSAVVDQPEAMPWVERAMELLLEALAEWGVGAKTNAGYGRLYDMDTWHPPRRSLPTEREAESLSSSPASSAVNTSAASGPEASSSAQAPSSSSRREYQPGQIIRARRVEESGRRGRNRQRYEIVGDPDTRAIVYGRENDVEVGTERELRVISFDRTDWFVTAEPVDTSGV
ncbi:MAG: type III-B CRISPR module RAMP protein Cmr6 [Firmicutes bacterium]|nr:type III-B CRISPR module RAMP protein Cmr6 [Bacillota bacterium]